MQISVTHGAISLIMPSTCSLHIVTPHSNVTGSFRISLQILQLNNDPVLLNFNILD